MQVDTIVVGFDGSSNARLALDAAADCLGADGVVHVVTAYHVPARHEVADILAALPKEFRGSYDVLAVPRDHLAEAERHLANRGTPYKAHFVEDDPATAILDVAKAADADLVIVGSRGLGRASRFIRGSVSSRVAAHAGCSFLVIHEDDD